MSLKISDLLRQNIVCEINDVSLRDMIYGLHRMIYLLCKYDIISVPLIREAYIISEATSFTKRTSFVECKHHNKSTIVK